MDRSSIGKRLARLRGLLDEQSIDALLVSQPESRYYLSGYSAHDLPPRDSSGYLVITRSQQMLLTDGRTIEQGKQEAPDFNLVEMTDGVAETLASLTEKLHSRKVGFEGIHLPYHLAQQLRLAVGESIELVETVGLVDILRIEKDESELEAMRRAIAISDACVDHLLGWIRPGLTEKEVAWEIEIFSKTHGADAMAFDSIVASGPNGAMPHAKLTDKKLVRGEPIVIDMGVKFDHYCSDISRTICLGEPPDWLRQIYDVVLQAQERAEQHIRAGMTGRQADELARSIIVGAGFGDNFRHSLGHGIGLEAHEPPRVSWKSSETLQQGTVFSVEPGIYLLDKGGVRIEDLAWLSPSGIEVLTKAPKGRELLEI